MAPSSGRQQRTRGVGMVAPRLVVALAITSVVACKSDASWCATIDSLGPRQELGHWLHVWGSTRGGDYRICALAKLERCEAAEDNFVTKRHVKFTLRSPFTADGNRELGELSVNMSDANCELLDPEGHKTSCSLVGSNVVVVT